jgi:four helix bundle protein
MKDYKNLEVFVQTRELIKSIYAGSEKFPAKEIHGLTSQIRRSAISALSNFSEGLGRQTKKDTIQFLYISRGSMYELETQLLISSDLGYMDQEVCDCLLSKIEACKKLLSGYIKYYKSLINDRRRATSN